MGERLSVGDPESGMLRIGGCISEIALCESCGASTGRGVAFHSPFVRCSLGSTANFIRLRFELPLLADN